MIFYNNQQANGMHVSEAVMSAPGIGCVSLALRYPNDLGIKSVEQCEFFDDFKNFCGRPVNANTLTEMIYLKNRIKHYCEAYDLYYRFKVPNTDIGTRFPIIEILGV